MKKKSPSTNPENSSFDRQIKWVRWILLFSALILYGPSVTYDFTLDDDSFYINNPLVKQGVSHVGTIFSSSSLGAGSSATINQPYRPLTMLSFALDKSLFNATARGAHLVNLILYALLLQVLFTLLKKLFPTLPLLLIGSISLLFAAHPIHSEVVASIKSRDEILAALFGFLAWIRFIDLLTGTKKGVLQHVVTGFLFLLAVLSKESGIVFLALAPLSAILLSKVSIKHAAKATLPLVVGGITFVLIRQAVIGNAMGTSAMPILDNILFAARNGTESIATRFAILYHYLKLIIIPWPLVWDYSYQQLPVVDWTSGTAWLGLISMAVLLVMSILFVRKNPLIAFCAGFYLLSIAPISNIFFVNSTTLGERLLFVPSLSWCIAIPVILQRVAWASHRWSLIGTATIVTAFTVLTLRASAHWKNDLTLFQHGVAVSPNSARTHFNLGTTYWKTAQQSVNNQEIKGFATLAISEIRRSLDLYPNNFMAMTNLGCLYDMVGNFDSSRYCFEKSLSIFPNQPMIGTNLSSISVKEGLRLESIGDERGAIASYLKSAAYDSLNLSPLNNLGLLYTRKQQYDSAFIYFSLALSINGTDASTLENYAVASFFAHKYDQAIAFATKHITLYGNSRKMLGVLSDCNYAKGNFAEVNRLRVLLEPTQ